MVEQLCLPDLLWEQVRVRPDRTAVIYENTKLTYSELAHESARLAGYLRHLGVSPDDCLGLFVEPSVELMVGAWGILLAGGAYLPLSPEYPEERLRYMIADARAKVIFCQEELRARLTALAPHGTRIVTTADAARSPATTGEGRPAGPGNLAYVIYTSGSTGKPKGVMIEHRAIVNQLAWLRTAYRLDEDRVVLQKTPMSFDAAQWEILAPACGSRVVIGGPGVHRDPERLIEIMAGHEVTTVQCVPTLLQAFVDTEELHRCQALRQVFSGGEALSKGLALQCVEALPWCELVNLYGPTECTINSSAYTVDPATVAAGPNAIPIGRPVDNTRYHILDAGLSEAAAGEVGELYIGGIQLARGYLHRPDLTEDRFVDDPFRPGAKLFRTGDLACWNPDGTAQFIGRTDNQVKLRGHRVELDEIKLEIETHDWVKTSALVVQHDAGTGFQNLVAFVELNPKEAALMDQGNHGAHHQSKESRLQVKAQLSNMGCRDDSEISGKVVVDLPGREPTQRQRRQAFARKTYRFFEGADVWVDDILRVLGRRPPSGAPRRLDEVTFADLGGILRYFGQYLSGERLLPKYGYASPGSLYATQMYFEVGRVCGLSPGYYYYHPVRHQLILIRSSSDPSARIKVHFIGKKRAIQPVYKNNIQEVLEIETGHMVGLFEEILPDHGLGITALEYLLAEKDNLECAAEDYYLGSFELGPNASPVPDEPVDIYVQVHPGGVADLPSGQYRFVDGALVWISDELILKKHVIAINQQVHERSSLGITVVSRNRTGWMGYVDLGRTLQRLSMNDLGLGFMPSGYSSETGADLPSALRIAGILAGCGLQAGPSYFFVGGRVSPAQLRSEGMKEDVVHMKGPAEMIRDDLIEVLPDYMIPNRVAVLDRLPVTANGKIDLKALEAFAAASPDLAERAGVPPRTVTEARIAEIWQKAMKRDTVSVRDDFFATGGNSLIAVGLINKINREFRGSLPLQVLFESPTIEALARRVDRNRVDASRLVRLRADGSRPPVYCWPGLGGYPMNLRLLASKLDIDRPFFGVQAHGINEGETPYADVRQMAAADVELIRRLQPAGPYMLWGYSFGARPAFEAAYQIEQAGERVEQLFLIAPGAPKVPADDAYVTVLFSVFAGTITGPLLTECLATARDDTSFVSFITRNFDHLDPDLVRRISRIVSLTYQFEYTFRELAERRINAPVTIVKASGDDYSFIENISGPVVARLRADHYSMLRDPDIDELVATIHGRLGIETKEAAMPHVNIKYMPVPLSEDQQSELVAALTNAVSRAFRCDEGVVSIALEPVEQDVWNERVYVPEIVNRKELLRKTPNY